MFKKSIEQKEGVDKEKKETQPPESGVDRNSLNNENMPPRPDKS
jgi:hypothetical protein